jgi:hypothetical protein
MGSVELDNANPTILSISELPSHRQRRKGGEDSPTKKHGIRDILMAKPTYTMDPFYLSDFSDTDSDDSTVEPIDEQEIYGEPSESSFLCSFCLGSLLRPFCIYHSYSTTQNVKHRKFEYGQMQLTGLEFMKLF